MKLDSRILDGKRPLTCLDVEQAREFEGKQCLFSDSYVNYKNISEYVKHPQYTGTLVAIRDKFQCRESEESPYRNGNDGYFYELVLPLEWVKEFETPEFVPYTLDTWGQDFKLGDELLIRLKDDESDYMYKGIYTGWSCKDKKILIAIGSWLFCLTDFFSRYEIYRNEHWEPFGKNTKEGE